METITLNKFSHEHYSVDEYHKFNRVPRDAYACNLFNLGTKNKPDMAWFHFKKSHNNLTESEWRKVCFSPYVDTKVNRVTVVVDKIVDEGVTKKVRISKYITTKGRKCGKKYFWKKRKITHITFNVQDGNVYKVVLEQSGKKRQTSVQKNPFKFWLRDGLTADNVISDLRIPQVISTHDDGVLSQSLITNPDMLEIKAVIRKGIKGCLESLCGELELKLKSDSIKSIAATWFCINRGIKIPNKWIGYFNEYYPGIKPMRKFGNNLIHTILNEYGVKSKYAIKLLNTNEGIDLDTYKLMVGTIGIEQVRRVNPEIFKVKLWSTYEPQKLTNSEKRNLVSILNSTATRMDDNTSIRMTVNDIMGDHLNRLKTKIMSYGINVKIKATTYDEFSKEHSEWYELYDELVESNVITHHYDNNFIESIERPIIINGIKMTPKVLTNTREYKDESREQSNCVKTYITDLDTCIISLRGTNRVTIEYVPYNNTIINQQCRERFNKRVSEQNEPFINELDERMVELFKNGVYNKKGVTSECKVTNKTEDLVNGNNSVTNDILGLPF